MNPEEAAALSLAVALEMGFAILDEDALYAARRGLTMRHDNPHLAREAGASLNRRYGSSNRAYAPGLARFANVAMSEPVSRERAALDRRHPALRDGGTIFPARVFDADQLDRVLISGINNAKLGRVVTKGAWAGSPIYHLSLEERRTCPRSCPVWAECYGNGMPAAVRLRYNANLMLALARDLGILDARHPDGFVVRLHVLGDFPDLDYVRAWSRWSDQFGALQVEGYTAHPRDSEIGRAIHGMNLRRPMRWQIRNSVPLDAPWEPMQATTVWTAADMQDPGPASLVCPQELGKTATCGTCALCWSPAMANTRIVFLGHGGQRKAK